MTQDPLLAELLDKPTGPAIQIAEKAERPFTKKIELSGSTIVTEFADSGATEGTALSYLEEEGQDPDDWEVTGFRKIKYGAGMESIRFTFRRRANVGSLAKVDLNELFKRIKKHKPVKVRPQGDHGFLVLLGDMQFGKIDGDGVEGSLARTIGCLDRSADALQWYRQRFDIGHVHIGWLGDHIEGFVSQGGANVWRTPLTLNEQIRLTRRTMLHALEVFAPLADRVSMAAVPGNHGEAIRFAGKGVTRYDDSHDTESLIAVSDAAKLNPDAFGHVEFYVPETDELTVVLDVAGTVVAHAHGHQWRPSKHLEWWQGQAFNKGSAMHEADLLVAGHLHHEVTDSWDWRTFIQPPAMESESTWWRHSKGPGGAPGNIVAVTKDGRTDIKEVVR